MSDSVTPWIAARQASLSITNFWSSLRLTSIESVMPSSHLILCRPLLLLPPIPPSISVFSNESTLRMRWPKYWSFSFSIIPSKEIPGLVSFRMDWLEIMVSKWYHLGSEYWWQFWIFFFPPFQLCFTFLALWALFWYHWKYMLSSKQILSLNKGLKHKYISHLRMGQVWCPETQQYRFAQLFTGQLVPIPRQYFLQGKIWSHSYNLSSSFSESRIFWK